MSSPFPRQTDLTITATDTSDGWRITLDEPGKPHRALMSPKSLKDGLLWAIEQYEPLLAVELGADPLTVLQSALARKTAHNHA